LNLLRVFIFILISGRILFSQQDSTSHLVSNNYEAQSFFIEGKTLELQFNFSGALENYKTALKYDKAPGIYYAIANVYYSSERYQDAIIEINNALKYSPDEIKYLELKGNIYFRQENYEKAAEVYENIIAVDSNYIYGLYFLGRMYQELKMSSKAIVIYEKITDIAGFDYEVLKRMYEVYFNYKEFDKCLTVLQYVLRLDPYDAMTKQQLAGMYLKTGNIEKAREIYEELETLYPNDKVLITELIKIYFSLGEIEKGFSKFAKSIGKDTLDYEEKLGVGEIYFKLISEDSTATGAAKSIFSILTQEYPDRWIPFFYLGSIEFFVKNKDEAEKYFQLAEIKADTVKNAYYQIGYTYFEYGSISRAKEIYLKGLNLYPDDYMLNYMYGLSLQREGNTKEAIKYFENAHRLSAKDVQIMGTLALAYNTERMYKESEEMYERALETDPDNVLILNNYAYNLSVRGLKLDKALAMAKKVIENEPENASYLDTYGWVLYKLGDYENAVVYIKKSLSKNASSAVVTDHLGDVYYAMGDYDNAQKYWKKALELSPASIEIKQKIEKNKK